jgi:sterol 3beta-glucosyltransferase
MKVGIFTFGSRGDVQPYLAVAVGLRRAGHDVFLCAPADFAELAAAYDIPFRAMSMSFQELVSNPAHILLLKHKFTGVFRSWRQLKLLSRKISSDAWRLLQDAEAIIFTPLTSTAYGVARKLDVPSFMTYCLPLDPSRELAPIFAGASRRRGPLFNRLASEIGYRVMWRIFASGARRLRRELGLPPLPFFGPLREFARIGEPIFYLFSPSVLPKPSDWREDIHVVGFGFLESPAAWEPSAELVRFLEAGPPPVYIGFGSMPNMKPAETTALLVQAVERSGQRAILQSGQAQLGDGVALPENFFLAGDVPHRWLFERVAAVMHHGGAGTTAAGFRAGVPQIIVPHMLDQPFWAHTAFELGVSPQPVRASGLSVDRVAGALRAVTTDLAMRRRAAEIGAKIRGEDGVGRTVQLFNEYVARFRSTRALPGRHQPETTVAGN